MGTDVILNEISGDASYGAAEPNDSNDPSFLGNHGMVDEFLDKILSDSRGN